MSHTRNSPSHNLGGISRFLARSVASCSVHEITHGDKRGGHMYQISHSLSHNRGVQYSAPLGYPPDDFPWVGVVKIIKIIH